MNEYYFSQEQYNSMIRSCRYNRENYVHAYFKGREFTEQRLSGKGPNKNFSDMKLIGNGTDKDCTYKEI